MDKDINEAFEDIFLSEEKTLEKAYQEAFEKGRSEGNTEAYHLGYHRGAEIGAELGYYLGTVLTYKEKPDVSDKTKHHLNQLEDLIRNYPKTNDENVDIIEMLDNIRAMYRKTCSLLKISGLFPEADDKTF